MIVIDYYSKIDETYFTKNKFGLVVTTKLVNEYVRQGNLVELERLLDMTNIRMNVSHMSFSIDSMIETAENENYPEIIFLVKLIKKVKCRG